MLKQKTMTDFSALNSPKRILSLTKERATVSFPDSDDKVSGFAISEEHGPKPSEVYGFVGSISTVVTTGIFLVWAYVPEPWLHSVGITYYPSSLDANAEDEEFDSVDDNYSEEDSDEDVDTSVLNVILEWNASIDEHQCWVCSYFQNPRYWALAVPAYAMVTVVLAMGFYLGLNFMATPPRTSLNTMFGKPSLSFDTVLMYKNLVLKLKRSFLSLSLSNPSKIGRVLMIAVESLQALCLQWKETSGFAPPFNFGTSMVSEPGCGFNTYAEEY
ncbi:hypothetical protein HHK36_006571 [Tetracentron sinense]|uniref:PIG-P domain-containing protein n=1 Tax=Tetracentron sinense TaxID=13715 RepID=A0A834ZLS8_TETSI|nr:hypothetical protein HHK36_006571 [Tetracentron sinense]